MDIDFNKIKEDQITQLTKMKDMLKEKLQEVKEENTRLQAEVISLKQGGTVPADSGGTGDMMGKFDKLFEVIVNKLDKILFTVSQPPSFKGTPVIQTGNIQQATQLKPVEEIATSIRTPSQITSPPQPAVQQPVAQQPVAQQPVVHQQPIQAQPAAPEPAFKPRRPSDILKAQQAQPAPAQPAPVQPAAQPVVPQATEYEGGTGQVGATPAVIPPVGGKEQTIMYPADGVIKCPKCGKQEWKEMADKTKRPQYGIYPKKYYCKMCRAEWVFQM